MPKLILTVGASSSGKSTWADKYCDENSGTIQINRDSVRFGLHNYGVRDWTKYKFSKSNEKEVTTICDSIARDAVDLGSDIVISDTNLSDKVRNKWHKFAEDNGYTVEVKVFYEDWDTLRTRNAQRYGGISESILWDQYLRMDEFLGRRKYIPDESLPKAFIVDVDGTIAKMDRHPFDWANVDKDLPRKIIISMVHGLIDAGYTPIFMSGRDGSCVTDTYSWIQEHVMGYESFMLVQRQAGDSRKDYVVKQELFWKYVAHNYNVVAAIDDRPQVLRIWQELGIENIIDVSGNRHKEF